MLLYVRKDSALFNALADLRPELLPVAADYELDRVHPELFSRRMRQRTIGSLLRDATLGRLKRLF